MNRARLLARLLFVSVAYPGSGIRRNSDGSVDEWQDAATFRAAVARLTARLAETGGQW